MLLVGAGDAMTELADAECRVSEMNACIDRQRQHMEELAAEGHDITSAQIILDSLLISLYLSVESRHRLRTMLDSRKSKASAA
jgi:hypothetical protein